MKSYTYHRLHINSCFPVNTLFLGVGQGRSFPHFVPEPKRKRTLRKISCWRLNERQTICMWHRSHKVSFQRKVEGMRRTHYRSLRITRKAFEKLRDVTILPGHSILLDNNLELISYGKSIKLTRYCLSRDKRQCEGNIFIFTEQDWQTFWNEIRPAIEIEFSR